MVVYLRLITLALSLALATSGHAQESPLPPPSRAGIGVDARGGAVIDPTENVKALNEAASKRQDDLRSESEKLFRSKVEASEAINSLRYLHAQEQAALRAEYDEKLRTAEKNRIDAIRAVDVNAVAVASTRATDQASVLATQVSKSAEDLRALVATTAATALQNQQQQFATLSARLTTLEQAGYQQAGKQTYQDPQILALVTEVRNLSSSRTDLAGVNSGRSDVIGWIVGGGMFFVAIGSLLLQFGRRAIGTGSRR